jgi:peptide/nickel transport system substrate-binding protein
MKTHPASRGYAFLECLLAGLPSRGWLVAALLLGVSTLGWRHEATVPSSQARPTAIGRGDTLVRRLEESVTTLNPICRQTLSDRYVAQYLFTPLIHLAADLTPVPGLATSWTVSSDGRVYTFTLNPRATFSDGTKVTAQDVLFTLQRIVDPASIARDEDAFRDLDPKKTRVLGPTKIEVAFTKPRATRLLRFADVLVLPAHVYSRGNFRNDHNEAAVGSGPYVLEQREASRITVVRRKSYWREMPPIPRVTFQTLTDYHVAWRAVKTGEVDEAYVPSTAWTHERVAAARQHKLAFLQFYTARFSFVAWNTRRPILRDVRVRRALAMSFNAAAAVHHIYEGTARVLTAPLPPETADYNRAVAPITFAPSKARRLLADAGWRPNPATGLLERNGVPLRLEMLSSTTPPPRMAEAIQNTLAKIGVRVDITTMDRAAAVARFQSGEFDATFMDMDFNGDPDLYPLFHSSQTLPSGANLAAYNNAAVDDLLEQARKETNDERRHALHRRAHAIVAAEQPYSWYVQVTSKWAISPRVEGVAKSPTKGLFLWYPGEFGWKINNRTK